MATMPHRVSIITGPRHGGPLRWARDLTRHLDKSGEVRATLTHTLGKVLLSQVYCNSDIIHTTLPTILRGWRKPYVLTVKGDLLLEPWLWRTLYPKAIRSANLVTVPSRYLIDRYSPLSKAIVIPNAVDLESFIPTALTDREELRIVMVTNFWYPNKIYGVQKVIDIFLIVTQRLKNKPCSLTIVGDGQYLAQVKRYAAARNVSVHFPGWADPRSYLTTADVFVYYSLHDNMPNAVLEAMACGLPVLTNHIGAVSEMIFSGDDGYIAETDEVYAVYLQRLLEEYHLRQRIGQAARKRIERNFSWSVIVQRYLDIYRSLL